MATIYKASELIARFVTGHVVTQQDMTDLCNSIWFNEGESDFILYKDTIGWDQYGFLMMPLPHDTTIISLPSLGIIHVADMSLLNPTTVDLSGNIITIYTCPSSFLNVTTFNISSNKLNLASIASILHVIALSGSVCAVDVSGKDMASHSTWTSTMLADETTITNNGGSVHSQP